MPFVYGFSNIAGGRHGSAGTHPHQKALFPGQTTRHFKCTVIVDVDLLIQAFLFKNFRLIGLPHIFEALNFVTQIWFHADNLDFGIDFLKPPLNSHKRSRRTQGRDDR